MPERTQIEIGVRYMVAADILSKPLSSLGDKAARRRTNLAKELGSLIRHEGEIGERIFAKIEKRDEEEKARTLREGIDAFEKEYPRYGAILEGLIEEKRTKRNKYLVFGLQQGYHLGTEDYLRVMKDLGLSAQEACAIYPHLQEFSDRLGKAKESDERSILL